MAKATIAAMILALGPLWGCAGAGGDSPDSGQVPDTGTGCGSTLTYANFGQSFLDANCNSCHAWTQSSVQADGQIMASAVLDDAMPPGGSLTGAQRQQFSDWVSCGAP